MSRRIAWLVAAGLLALFLLIATAMRANVFTEIDQALLHLSRQPGATHRLAGPPWELPLLLDVTTLGAGVVRLPLTIGVTLLLALLHRPREAAALFGGVASGAIALPIVKALFHRARPDLPWHLTAEGDWSFPSGHSMGAMILYPLLFRCLLGLAGRPRLGLLLGVLVALAVGATRVMLGVHWASDVAAAWCLGGAWTAATLALIPPDNAQANRRRSE